MPEAIENARHRLPPTYASHAYKVLGKVDLSDSVWLEVKENTALAEVVFDEAIPKGTYLLTLYTRSGRGTDFKVIHCRSEVSVK